MEVWYGGMIWRYGMEVWYGSMAWRYGMEVCFIFPLSVFPQDNTGWGNKNNTE